MVPTGAVAFFQRCDRCAVLLLVGRGAPAQLQQLLALPAHGRAVRAGRRLMTPAALVSHFPQTRVHSDTKQWGQLS